MKNLTAKELAADRDRYKDLIAEQKELLADIQQRLAETQVAIFRLEGAYTYVVENLTAIEEENTKKLREEAVKEREAEDARIAEEGIGKAEQRKVKKVEDAETSS